MIAYSFNDLQELSGAIGKAHSSVDSLKGDVKASSGQLQADWSGSAGESWAGMQAKWDSACDNLVAALNQLSRTVLANSDDMSATEARNAGLFSGA
ncbi:WXG100 family type VII secretion target [Kineosporia sp. J2-2]|uniref:ESAT-6-like protein n=1 Tax=Kineosporia corallincola TaxID=2835133 RepID=A0ABS5TAM9_9ACTN|nr:WXG100 family type VII secretion target [Kineosporia corallincola]MBT0768124.1 WXG100 family type VII secretion target [Kineosporia corallincola]